MCREGHQHSFGQERCESSPLGQNGLVGSFEAHVESSEVKGAPSLAEVVIWML